MGYPATFTLEAPDKIARWRPLLQWIMAIPHLIVVYVIYSVAQLVSIVAWIVIVFTGKLPEGLAGFLCMSLRYQIRVTAYVWFLHAEYPPFDFATTAADPGDQPVRVDFEPAFDGRERLTVLLRLFWLIPAWWLLIVVQILAGLLCFIAFFAVLITGKWPVGMLNSISSALRFTVRFYAYSNLLTDEYPPFRMAA